jgi:hypothetical protein
LNPNPRRALCRVALFLLMIGGLPRAAAAEWHLTPLIGFTFKGDTTLIDLGTVDFELASSKRHWNFGGAVTLIGEGPVGVEGLMIYTPGFFQTDDDPGLVHQSRTTALMGNLVLATPRRWNEYGLRPFISGGLGLLRASAEDLNQVELFEKPVNIFGFNIGGGAVGFLSERTGLRFDFRYFSHVRPVEDPDVLTFGPIELSYWNVALGFVFRY